MTSAAPLLNVPSDGPSWDRWSWDLQANIDEIIAAIQAQRGVLIARPGISPIPFFAAQDWLERVSGVLGEITSAVGVQAVDVENVDLDDDAARQAWVYSVFTEVNAARRALRI